MSEETVEADNFVAIEAITSRLTEVADLVESLEQIYKETQDDLGISEPELEVDRRQITDVSP